MYCSIPHAGCDIRSILKWSFFFNLEYSFPEVIYHTKAIANNLLTVLLNQVFLSDTNNFLTDLIDLYVWLKQIQLLLVRVDLEVIIMNGVLLTSHISKTGASISYAVIYPGNPVFGVGILPHWNRLIISLVYRAQWFHLHKTDYFIRVCFSFLRDVSAVFSPVFFWYILVQKKRQELFSDWFVISFPFF